MSDPLIGEAVAAGSWDGIDARYDLLSLGEDRLLFWERPTGDFRIWKHDRNVTGDQDDSFPTLLAQGNWPVIKEGHRLVYLGGDHLLDWQPATGGYALCAYDRQNPSDPFGRVLAQGSWSSIGFGHRLIYMGGVHLLDWVPDNGGYRLWLVDRDADSDPLPSLVTEGTWEDLQVGHDLVYLGGDRILEWEPANGDYRIWQYDRNC